MTSASIVGLPLESKISLALISKIVEFLNNLHGYLKCSPA